MLYPIKFDTKYIRTIHQTALGGNKGAREVLNDSEAPEEEAVVKSCKFSQFMRSW